MIIMTTEFEIDPLRHDEAVAASLEMQEALADFPGAISLRFFITIENPNVFFLYEVWRDHDAYEAHLKHPALHKVQKASKNYVVRRIRSSSFDATRRH
ncbi:antibiotic biosynthesis monooxygenase [Nocardia yamanashiensis]|uniref:putative quinol monooxygenase n=1 Tax=Nocardia yamanashiensis TaxID=209247 RepID=UPI001E3C7FDE|nr:antibiotic biosynthesis monooxygenase [Nocardia yamanashiensis]UGT38826.1 antibiotic biosynthesis monooxygenase [Nocardia yamanashiensis]